jgi:GDPmannose 4,6-dehydratase
MPTWGYAPDYVKAMWLMLLAETPDDYVVATGEPHSVREFVEVAFKAVGLDYAKYVQVDPVFFRPAEKVQLCGNPSRIVERLNWGRTRSFKEIVREMVARELGLYGATQTAVPGHPLPAIKG